MTQCTLSIKTTTATTLTVLCCKNIFTEKTDGGLPSTAVDFSRVPGETCRIPVFESIQARYRSRQVGVSTQRGAELDPRVFRSLIEYPQPNENVILKT